MASNNSVNYNLAGMTNTGIVKCNGTTIITSTTAKIDSSNRYTNTSQPCFLAYLGTTDSNISGDNTVFTIGSGNALTIVYDQNSNLTTGGTFTAPVTGKYYLGVKVAITGGVIINGAPLNIVTTARSYRTDLPNGPGPTTGNVVGSHFAIADMTAGDTATFTISTSDSGGKIDDLLGSGSPYVTYICGYLVC